MRKLVLAVLLLAACSDDGTGPEPPAGGHGVLAVVVTDELSSPVHLAAPVGDDRLFVVEQRGRILIVENGALQPTPFLDIRDEVAFGGERGLLSVAFDPDYATTGHFWVNYTSLPDGATRIERYTVSADPDIADASSAVLVLEVEQPAGNHNGGQLAFGPDGMLYIGMGDGGGCCDQFENSQDLSTLLGDILRIDVRATTAPYVIPSDNPYVGSTTARAEIWASGLRNPWRFSFDRESGQLWIADVGQGMWEEINVVDGNEAGLNYGWPIIEGTHCFQATTCDMDGLVLPVHEYSHADGCSVTGGFVYRGDRVLDLQGHYVYSDYCQGFLRSFRMSGGVATDHEEWNVGDIGQVTSFGEDADGEIYILSTNGTLYRIEPQPPLD